MSACCAMFTAWAPSSMRCSPAGRRFTARRRWTRSYRCLRARLRCPIRSGREWHTDLVRMIWLSVDALLMTAAFGLVKALTSPLLVCYALFIAASGLWFRVRLVWLTTALSTAGYVSLLIDAQLRGLDAGALH